MEWIEERKKLGVEWLKPTEKGWLETDTDDAGQEVEPQASRSGPDDFAFDPENSGEGDGSLLFTEDHDPGFEEEPVQTQAGPGDFDVDPDELTVPGSEPEIDAGLEPDLDFEIQPEAEVKSKPEGPSEQEKEYEIDYPGLEIFDSEEKK